MMSVFDHRRGVLSFLGAGFGLVIGLLALVAYLGITRSQRIHESIGDLVSEHMAHQNVLDRVELEQQRVSRLLLQIYQIKGVSPSQAASLLEEIRAAEERLQAMSQNLNTKLLRESSQSLMKLTQTFVQEVQRVATQPRVSDADLAKLTQLNLELVSLSTRVLNDDAEQSAAIESHIDAQSEELSRGFMLLLGISIALSLACAVLTIWLTLRFLDRLRWQSEEITKVTWSMLQGQEEAARRFSHEMHDELGQSLTGLKATLLGMQAGQFEAKRQDCIKLLDESISNVRELSQLLRPVILDDFGLAAGLQWLCERFTERTRIPVRFFSDINTRMSDETETHLFRITQEALTNIARHSEAREASVELRLAGSSVVLTIGDDGKGIEQKEERPRPSIGMIGMRARARQAGGDMSLKKSSLGGLEIEVSVPATSGSVAEERTEDEPQAPHLAGR